MRNEGMYKVGSFRQACIPPPKNRQSRKHLQDTACGYLSSGLCRCELQACRRPHGPESRAGGRKQDWTYLGAGVLRDPGIREGLSLSESEARAGHRDKRFTTCLIGGLSLGGTYPRELFLGLAWDRMFVKCLELGDVTWSPQQRVHQPRLIPSWSKWICLLPAPSFSPINAIGLLQDSFLSCFRPHQTIVLSWTSRLRGPVQFV